MTEPLLIGKNAKQAVHLLPGLMNRHGLITGATGTGKTVSLQIIAEHMSNLGVPVFMADVKGDLAGLSQAGRSSPKLAERIEKYGLPAPAFTGFPVTLWDVWGKEGHPLRATISDMGPLLISRMLGLNDTQEGVLQLVFKIADDNRMLLLDSKDLRAMLQYVGENARDFKTEYGNISSASIGTIQRGMLALEEQGGDRFFGEPMLNIDDLLQTDGKGRGVINVLAADQLMNSPRLYATFLLWLLSELFEHLPEVGDRDKPKLVFFFDEAHLMFNEAPRALMEKVEQVVRLIRSKGVGVFFVTQNPLDIPDTVLGQLGNRIQHALRAFTPRDQKAVRAAAETMRANPAFETEQVISELGVGEALVSTLDEKGRPNIVERVFIVPPASRIGPIDEAERKTVMAESVVAGVYDKTEDRESAYEILRGRAQADEASEADKEGNGSQDAAAEAPGSRLKTPPQAAGGWASALQGMLGGSGRKDSIFESAAKSAARSVGSSVGRAIVRGVLGSLLKGK